MANEDTKTPDLPTALQRWLFYSEVIGVCVATALCVWGALAWAWRTGGSMVGLLTAIDTHWKGALILGALLMFRTLLLVLSKARGLYEPWTGGWQAAGDPTTVKRPSRAKKASS